MIAKAANSTRFFLRRILPGISRHGLPMPKNGQPLSVFVHVPKTGGTSVIRSLERWSPGVANLHLTQASPRQLRLLTSLSLWVEGHMSLDEATDVLAGLTSRNLRFFGTMREPTSQVASHYNYVIHSNHRPAAERAALSPGVLNMASIYEETDNSDPSAIAWNLSRNPGLFLNLQSRMLLGGAAEGGESDWDGAMARYEKLLPLSRLPELISAMTGKEPGSAPHENKVPYHFDPAVFQTPEMRAFLSRKNAIDERLWQRVNGPG